MIGCVSGVLFFTFAHRLTSDPGKKLASSKSGVASKSTIKSSGAAETVGTASIPAATHINAITNIKLYFLYFICLFLLSVRLAAFLLVPFLSHYRRFEAVYPLRLPARFQFP